MPPQDIKAWHGSQDIKDKGLRSGSALQALLRCGQSPCEVKQSANTLSVDVRAVTGHPVIQCWQRCLGEQSTACLRHHALPVTVAAEQPTLWNPSRLCLNQSTTQYVVQSD
jgi:hypothetical protein